MFRRAWRRLWAAPAFTLFAVLSLALGVGVTTAIYSVIVSITRSGANLPAADRIGIIVGTDPNNPRRQTFRSLMSRADFDDLSRASLDLKPFAISAGFYQSLTAEGVSEAVTGEAVSGNYFSTLGLAPEAGRLIQPGEDATPSRVVVLSHRFWRTRFQANRAVVGSSIRIGGEPFEVIGIAPEGFSGLTNRIQAFTSLWVPIASTTMFPSQAAPPKDPADRRRRQLAVFGLLQDPTALSRVSQAITAVGLNLDAAYPLDLRRPDETNPQIVPRNWAVRTLADVNDELEGQFLTFEAALTAIVGLVLVVACTNLANLILARGSSRAHELAVRRALGASRTRLVFDQMAESWLLAAMGSIAAFVVIRLLLIWFSGANLPISEASFVQLDPRLNWTTLGLAGAAMVGSLIVFGVAPAIQLTRAQVRPALSSEGGSTGHLRWRTRRTLIAVQVMISLSFFLMAAFAVRLVRSERDRPSGVDVDRLAIGLLNFQLPPWDEPTARQAIDRLMAAAETQPIVDHAAVASGMPFGTNYTPGADVTPIEKPFTPGHEDYSFASFISATPSVFATLGVPIERGRAFDARDLEGGNPVAVVSGVTARQLFGTADALGRSFLIRSNFSRTDPSAVLTLTVIGIAGDTDTQQRRSRQSGVVWVPLAQHYEPLLALVGRTSGDPADLVPALKTLATRADPNLVLDRPGTAAVTVTGLYVLMDDVSRLAGGLAALALVLGMAGLFGVLSHIVSRRTREMGVRLALGAEPSEIRWLVVRDGLQPVVSGLTMGFLIALAVRLLLRSAYASPFSMTDAAIFVLAPLPILAAALVACYWPAKRASSVHPNVALREL